MTVYELIEKLKKCDFNSEVLIDLETYDSYGGKDRDIVYIDTIKETTMMCNTIHNVYWEPNGVPESSHLKIKQVVTLS